MRIDGAGAVVSGGASGLGEATVRRLHALGACVAIVDRNGAAGDAIAKELGARVVAVETDVCDEHGVQQAVDAASALAPLRIAVNCAGIGKTMVTIRRDNSPAPLDLFEEMWRVNALGTFNVMRLCAARMAISEPLDDGERGVIVNTVSIAAHEGQRGSIGYSASKGAVAAMTEPAARDLAPIGVRVCAISPGGFETPLMHELGETGRQIAEATILFPKRIGQPHEFAGLVQHIVENVYLNAQIIRLDAGMRNASK